MKLWITLEDADNQYLRQLGFPMDGLLEFESTAPDGRIIRGTFRRLNDDGSLTGACAVTSIDFQVERVAVTAMLRNRTDWERRERERKERDRDHGWAMLEDLTETEKVSQWVLDLIEAQLKREQLEAQAEAARP